MKNIRLKISFKTKSLTALKTNRVILEYPMFIFEYPMLLNSRIYRNIRNIRNE